MAAIIPLKRVVSPSVGEAIDRDFQRLHRLSRERPAPTAAERVETLGRLHHGLRSRQEDFVRAIDEDFGHRSRHETLLGEVFLVLQGIQHSRRHLRKWMRPQGRRTSLPFLPARSEVRFQPKGLVGVISPWNYPLQLSLLPVAAALAAGNRVMLKPSELTPKTSALLADFLRSTLGPETVAVVTGGPEVGARFASQAFDHLLYTGSTQVGRLVMRAAAENLTPVTLELGGKSPAIVHRDYPLHHAAQRIAAGKFFNAGQTCIAPDYVLAPRERVEAVAQAICEAVETSYPSLATNPDYTAIINERHRARLQGYLDDARDKGAQLCEVNPAHESSNELGNKLAPHILVEVTDDMSVMQEEIFGPILPIVAYDSLEDAIRYVNERPRPLALYYFDRDARRVDRVLNGTVAGGTTINDTILQVGQDDLPFGGIGPSGMGAYHGREGFETFSHKRGVLHQSRLNAAGILSPPYGRAVETLLKVLLR